MLKQYEEEVNYKLLTDEEAFSEGKYYKLNEKVLLRTDSKTQMEIFATGVQNGIQKVNECRRKLDLMDAEGGDQLIVNGNYIPITEVGKQYEKSRKCTAAKRASYTAGNGSENAEGSGRRRSGRHDRNRT